MCVSQLAYSSASEAEPNGRVPPCLEKNSYLAPIHILQLKNEAGCGQSWGFNERPVPGMYGQVYLVKISDLFF